MSERKLMVEVTKEELEKLEGGFEISKDDIINALLKISDEHFEKMDALSSRLTRGHIGTLWNDKFRVEFTIIEN